MTPEQITRRMNDILYTNGPLRRANLRSLFLCAFCCFAVVALKALPIASVWVSYAALLVILVGIASVSVAIMTYVVAYRRAVEGEGE